MIIIKFKYLCIYKKYLKNLQNISSKEQKYAKYWKSTEYFYSFLATEMYKISKVKYITVFHLKDEDCLSLITSKQT